MLRSTTPPLSSRRGGLCLLLLILVAACAGPRDGAVEEGERGSSVSIITPRAGGGRPTMSEEERLRQEDDLQAMLDEAAMLNVKEDYRGSLAVIRHALSMNPPEPFGHRFRALEIRVRKDLLRRSYLDAFVRFDRDWYSIGETIEGEIIVMNISDKELVIPASRMVELPADAGRPEGETSEESRTMIRSVMTYREFLPTNTIITNRRTENFGVPEDIRLQPGETFRVPVTVDSSEINVTATMYRRYRIDCSLHAVEIRVGDELFHGALEFRGGAVGVFPRNAEHLADAPLDRVRQALAKSSPIHVSLAAAFIDAGDDAERGAYEQLALEELLRPDGLPRMQDALMCGLAIIADDENTRTKDQWIAWLQKKRMR